MIPARTAIAIGLATALAGCNSRPPELFAEPSLSPVGSGVYQYQPAVQPASFPAAPAAVGHSLWTDRGAEFYRDPRAMNVGDIVTVKIRIKDSASLANNTNRSRDSNIAGGLDFDASLNGVSVGTLGGTLGANDKSESKGKGSVTRSESIDLSVAAVVTQVMPNGNLFISGQQEVRVNFELRVLTIAGLIRPRDILPDNTIDYDKIAEARISYGGRGRLTEVQQPGWGQQIFDVIAPY
ncbi:flagellar basal body L-ring protein FlgH [Mangrovibrevibacter kandeliae]|uniref:flagellar basal body L-ring protein FlgH n=1 Tax=Mangrovibrevibacter kandeliae TaxID=2968473 RepID=UPI002117AB47|nr:flagellar basal body L-ring protein FlgH [Aurantimonas sp. CSK15Z-1]